MSHITSYLPKAPDPFLMRDLVDDMVSYPASNDDITFVVDDSERCHYRLQAALSNASNMFAYEGTFREPDRLWELANWMPLFFDALSVEEQQAAKTCLEQKELPIDALLKVASPAPFGRDGQAVFDPEFRKAFEIPSSRLPSDLIKALNLNREMEEMELAMKPASRKWTYHLYKIHMYGPGGKFEDHVDTLHANNHVATVVMALAAEHVGGILRVQHHGEVMEFDSAKGTMRVKYGSTYFCYGAFFTDCTHSVQEVISGWRVVVQYDVYEEGGDDNNGESQSDDEEITNMKISDAAGHLAWIMYSPKSVGTSNFLNKEQTELVQAVLQYLAKLPPAHGVAFFLRHRYSLPALDGVVLKGADRIIYDALSRRGDLSISVKGVLVYIQIEEAEEVSVEVVAVSMKDFLPAYDNGHAEQSIACGDSDSAETEQMEVEKITAHLIVDKRNGALRVHETEEMGNEPADGYNTYFVGCMIIRSNGKLAKHQSF